MKIFKKIGLILCSLVLAVGAFFMPFKSNKKSYLASADSSSEYYSFTGSSIFVPFYTDFQGRFFLFLRPHFYFDYSTSHWMFDYSYSKLYRSDYSYVTYDLYSGSSHSSQLVEMFNPYNQEARPGVFGQDSLPLSIRFYITDFAEFTFNGNISKVVIFSQLYDSHFNQFFVQYFDFNGCSFTIWFYVPTYFELFNERVYYLNNDYSDSQIYQNGYVDGLAAEQPTIYQNGFTAGDIAGYNRGYSAGVLDSNDYSFIGLIGAVFDVPLKTFQGALNYDLLGINLFNLFTALLTLSLILFIVKIALGGK